MAQMTEEYAFMSGKKIPEPVRGNSPNQIWKEFHETISGLLCGLFFFAGNLYAQTLFTLDFENEEAGNFPSGWDSRDQDNMIQVYTVQSEGWNKFLRADARGVMTSGRAGGLIKL